jgi:ABC-2 type transport system ATP-binding protein
MKNNSERVAIKVDQVSKQFKLPHEKVTSLKSIFINFYRRRRTFEVQEALKNVSFDVKEGEFFAIVGRNGSGKSTLLKLLAGIYVPNNGSVTVNGRLTPFIELGVGFNMDLTGRENVFLNGALLGFNRKEMESMYDDIVDFAELRRFMDQKLKNYSSGMQVRLAFSIAIRAKGDILLIDEVLAVGDADFQRKSLKYFKQLKKEKKTVVFVSHDMVSVQEFCDRGILIEDGVIKAAGNATQIAREYTLMFENSHLDSNTKGYRNRDPDDRPGNGNVRITGVAVDVNEQEIDIKVDAKVNKDVSELIYGLMVMGEDGREITGFNNCSLKKPNLTHLKSGSEIKFNWKIQNIFKSGEYSLTLSLVSTQSRYDDFVDAGFFKVNKEKHSNTAVLPEVSVKHTIA